MQRDSHWFTIFLAAVAALTSLSIDMSLPAVPALERAFHLPASHGSLTLSFFLAGYAVTPLVGGPLADRFGRRPVLIGSIALFLLASLACAAAPSFALLLLSRLLQGCSSGMAVALPLAIVHDLFESHAARQRIAEVTVINGLMPILAPLLGSWVMLLGGWRFIFMTQALFAAVVLVALLLQFNESLPAGRKALLSPAALARNYLQVFGNRTFLAYALMYACNFACIFSFISASPLILMQRMHVSRSAYTVVFGITVTGTLCGSFASGLCSRRRYPVYALVKIGMLVMTGACLMAAALQIAGLHRPWAIVPCIFVALFCFGITSPAIMLEALHSLSGYAGLASGGIRSLQMIVASAASNFLAVFCASSAIYPAVVTTLTMSALGLISLLLFFACVPRDEARLSPDAALAEL